MILKKPAISPIPSLRLRSEVLPLVLFFGANLFSNALILSAIILSGVTFDSFLAMEYESLLLMGLIVGLSFLFIAVSYRYRRSTQRENANRVQKFCEKLDDVCIKELSQHITGREDDGSIEYGIIRDYFLKHCVNKVISEDVDNSKLIIKEKVIALESNKDEDDIPEEGLGEIPEEGQG